MSVRDSGTAPAVDRGLQILGALAGFGALIYAVGAAVTWIRFATTGFNADQALTAVARGQLIVTGFRWLVSWMLVVSILVLVADRVARLVRDGNGAGARAWAAIGSSKWLTAGLVAMDVAAAFATWSVFTAAIAVSATALFMRWYLLPGKGLRESISPPPAVTAQKRTLGQLVTFVALLAAVSAIGWQLEINLPYDRAIFQVKGQHDQWDGIYFGELDGNFYIARRQPGNSAFYRSVSIYQSGEIQDLRVQPGMQTLCTRVNRPEVALRHAAGHVWQVLAQHLRRTGQPAKQPPQQLQPNLPDGQCPAQP
jgi:hypothetical protein